MDSNLPEYDFSAREAETKELVEAWEKYKFLKKDNISEIPDDKLECAVMSWMCNKPNEDFSNAYQIISSLPKPCQNIFSCRTVTDEVQNGGFWALFYNPSKQFAEMSIEGFLALGTPKLSNIMEKVVEMSPKAEEILACDDSPEAPYVDRKFEKLLKKFYRKCGSVDYVKYIRLNATCFGD